MVEHLPHTQKVPGFISGATKKERGKETKEKRGKQAMNISHAWAPSNLRERNTVLNIMFYIFHFLF